MVAIHWWASEFLSAFVHPVAEDKFHFKRDESPWGWHLLSITKHLAVTALLGLLALRLLRDRVAALVAATLFALHPAQTESVAWVTVPDPLMSMGILGAVLLYLKWIVGRPRKPSSRTKVAQGGPD